MPQIELSVDGKTVGFRANALTPRLYRHQFSRDLARDLNQINKKYEKVVNKDEAFEVLDLEIFENMAYIMAKQAAPETTPSTADEWLEGFEAFSIYEILPQILQLWAKNEATTSTPGKK